MPAKPFVSLTLSWLFVALPVVAAPKIVQHAGAVQEFAASTTYWTAERRAAAKPRDLLNRSTAEGTSRPVLEPRRSVAGADTRIRSRATQSRRHGRR